MRIISCSMEDISSLALMNKHLIEDEGSNNPMNVEELADRMRGFLSSDYNAYIFAEDGIAIGYALIKHTSSPLYLRQFYIDREYRRKHYGKQAFCMLLDHLNTTEIDVDVLPNNETGLKFWKSLGFKAQYISMRYKNF
ncbi:Ribosomal protein S18 acetylase RimI [Lachnospiraceae bacterium G11]|nr:Ribosomal protein S18 acetylase RimI [Lachnospiraceae bacterium G11]